MNKIARIAVVTVLIAAVGVVIVIKESNKADLTSKDFENPSEKITAKEIQTVENDKGEESKTLPRLVDLGAGKCIPCKMMAPVLEELKKEYQGRLDVIFIDVWEKPDEAKKYKINIIPTQIFFDASGREVFRNSGFLSKEAIAERLSQMGIK